jgi:hypothetical protein
LAPLTWGSWRSFHPGLFWEYRRYLGACIDSGDGGRWCDSGFGSSTKAAMQAALDGAALNLVQDAATLTNSQLKSKATDIFTAVFNRPEAENIQVSGEFEAQTATLTLTGSAALPTNFMGMFGFNSMEISALSKARGISKAGACVIALDKDASSAFKVSGGGTVNVPNCGIHVNSTAATRSISQAPAGSGQNP